ncbi:lysophospholipid acyltransferase family protein [Ornithinimicrobium cryptoxanthini]|uniref:lysophospholipid acyltransferase family protein n=1 Tax=Ornithinimicrobium cryptoxanthini TaxID=2934161 RepID=UPI0021177B89|nr:lysophospholipid acyltransferase family protein [Ornithinimicrobium cryptoxanthini]
MKPQPLRTKAPLLYRGVIATVRPLLTRVTRQDWSGGEHLPQSGGFIVAGNHISEIDPFMVAHFLVNHGHVPKFLAKAGLFDVPALGKALHMLGQVPVHRGTRDASAALGAAAEAVESGDCVVIMPEGTLSRDPGLWPMKAKNGVGRLALMTGAPVVPVAQWGVQRLLAPYARRPTGLFSRHVMHVKAGPAVDLSDLAGRTDAQAATEATDRIMTALTGLLAEIRGEEPPATPFVWKKDA